jgi:uncharacterized damage-inducible protein DinB
MFQKQSADYLRDEYLSKIELAIAPLTTEQIWWRPNDASNSIGNLILHLAGNVRQWIVGGVDGQAVDRDRDLEFSTRDQIGAAELMNRLRASVEDACAVMTQVTDAELVQPRTIQRFETTVFGAIYHVVEHFAMHTGQIILLAKAQTGRDAGFYVVRPDGTPEPRFSNRRAFSNDND